MSRKVRGIDDVFRRADEEWRPMSANWNLVRSEGRERDVRHWRGAKRRAERQERSECRNVFFLSIRSSLPPRFRTPVQTHPEEPNSMELFDPKTQ